MALSPQYSWPEPDNSSLVKNGAQDIRALGDAIDTSVWNVGYGQAGKNKIINGDFSVNQRGFTSTTSDGVYMYDRYLTRTTDGTVTYSAQTFTLGAAPVAGYEGKNYLRIVTTGQTLASAITNVQQRIEDVRTFAGQTVTVSFWAKANSGTPKIAAEFAQNFGSGGSAQVNTYAGQVTLSTSWERHSVTVSVPSVSGKTIGTSDFLILLLFVSAGSDFNARTGSLGIQSNTFEIWGVQMEYGSKATPFQTASGSIQGELAMCQRYYQVIVSGDAKTVVNTAAYDSTSVYGVYRTQVSMRTAPTLSIVSGSGYYKYWGNNNGGVNASAFSLDSASEQGARFTIGSVTVTTGYAYWIMSANASAFAALQAEL
jgi:hypothetical protein